MGCRVNFSSPTAQVKKKPGTATTTITQNPSLQSHNRIVSMDSFFYNPSKDEPIDAELLDRVPSKHAALSTIASRDEDDDDHDVSPERTDMLSSESPHGVESLTLTTTPDHWKKLLLPDLCSRHEHDRTHCHGRSISALPDLKYFCEDSSDSEKSTSSTTSGSSTGGEEAARRHQSIFRGQDKGSNDQAARQLRKHKSVSFHEEANVREFCLVAGDTTPNYDGSSSDGIPLSLGWEYETCTLPLQQRARVGRAVEKKSVEDMMLSPKERWEKLRTAGGYTDRQLWRIQRKLTLQDRDTFFNGVIDS